MFASRGRFSTGKRHVLQLVKLAGQLCYELPGPHFDFDRSFVRPDGLAALAEAAAALESDPHRKGMIFGHTDTVGPDGYNKLLSERRARSVLAVLTHDAVLAEKLRAQEGWGLHVTQLMLNAVRDPGAAAINEDGKNTPATIAAVKAFQAAHPPLAPDGDAGPRTRKELFLAYFKKVSEKPIDPTRFRDFGGERIMGCGEYNPFVGNNTEDQKSRRVVVMVFDPGGEPPPLPCKIGNIAACQPHLMKPGEVSPCPKNAHFRCRVFASIAAKCPSGPPTVKISGSWDVPGVDPMDPEPGSGPGGGWVTNEVIPSDADPQSSASAAWGLDQVIAAASEPGESASAVWGQDEVVPAAGEPGGTSYAAWVVADATAKPEEPDDAELSEPEPAPAPASEPSPDPELFASIKDGAPGAPGDFS